MDMATNIDVFCINKMSVTSSLFYKTINIVNNID